MSCDHPHLGLATTRELLDELRARFEIHATGGLDYRTVDGEKLAGADSAPLIAALERARNAVNAIVLSTKSISFGADLRAIDLALEAAKGTQRVMANHGAPPHD